MGAVTMASGTGVGWCQPTAQGGGPRFEILIPGDPGAKPVTGRLFLMISHRNEPEVRLQSTSFTSPEIVAVDVLGVTPGRRVVVNEAALGTPLRSLGELPDGDYFVQAVLNVYTEFHRADGHTLWAHMDQWEGQQFNTSPGNPYSPVMKVHLARKLAQSFELTLSKVIPPLPPLQDTPWTKHVKIQSKLLSEFWGHPIYLGAVILLPREYMASTTRHYPVIYFQRGHFNVSPPFDFSTTEPSQSEREAHKSQGVGNETGYEFYRAWKSEHFPQMIAVSLLAPTPLADWSGAVNSVNNGPYGDAITQELIPFIEKQFRIIPEPYARVLTGRASGGREALALQLMHGDQFAGAWIFNPWPFNFRSYSTLNIYEHQNAFEVAAADVPTWAKPVLEWSQRSRTAGQLPDGTPLLSFRQLSQHDAVMAGMAGGDPIGADDAILGPMGADGYPKRLWDRSTGAVDREVADYWGLHGDLARYAEREWGKIGPQLVGKLHFYVGESDVFYRNRGVHQFEEFLRTTRNPYYDGTFEYGGLKADWQPVTNAQLVQIMAAQIVRYAPKGADLAWSAPIN